MKKIMVVLLISGLFICSCNNNETQPKMNNVKVSKPIKYNEYIQDVFYGVPFGASKDEVIRGFKSNGLIVDLENSTDIFLSFCKRESMRFSFGGMDWDYVNVYLCNNRLYEIQFLKTFRTKESALSYFNGVFSKVSQKYHIQESHISDKYTYKNYIGRTYYTSQWVSLSCSSYESFSHEQYVGVWLTYGNDSYNKVSNEL